MPRYQGELDGLCGPYAVANAFELCGVEDTQRAFELACASLPARRWPKTLWEGTTFNDLKRMIRHCRNELEDAAHIRASYPFEKKVPRTNDEYWKAFDGLFQAKPNICCMIIGLTRPSAHWIVASRDSQKRIVFSDTDPHNPFQRKNRSSLFAGSRNGNPNKWIIDRSELIILEVTKGH